MGRGSPFFRELDLAATAESIGGRDGAAYRELVEPLVEHFDAVVPVLLGPWPPPPRAVARLARVLGPARLQRSLRAALADARSLAETTFEGERARAFLAGHAAHSMLPLERRPSAGFGLALLVMGHALSWGFPRGGAQRLADALVERLVELGGVVHASSA